MTKTYYTWDRLSDNVLMESDENGDTIATYSHEPGQYGRLLSQRRDGIASNYHFDAMGNTRAITQNGNVTDRYTFSAFGKEVARTGSTVNPWGYQGAVGYYANPGTEDLYVRARHYRPSIGRWLSTDPIGFVDGSNLFCYAGNSPIERIDPSGEESFHNCCSLLPCAMKGDPGPGNIADRPGHLPKKTGGRKCCNNLVQLYRMNPELAKLSKCTLTNNCLDRCRVFCVTNCARGKRGGYNYGGNPYIYICDGEFDNMAEAALTLKEEFYHALTICHRDTGTKVTRANIAIWNLLQRMPRAGIVGTAFKCGYCLGRELVAKRCAKRPNGCATLLNCWTEATASCSDCDYFGPMSVIAMRRDRLYRLVNTWFTSGIIDWECDKIDKQCGVK